ncbi:Oidioi.mRNA.OKI2018_I69.XSR.g16168.t1.cds [Oikopleura dioica]|uniref:Oidioi.mRNA.OKI2018_I69.XSR.g16168.t1.cds n=1 Tax=Oikopleura dioica TaxID=34765 RepID=A0ABN7SJ90_OIKDI|nr:Oidioi.mRNA.OKI2018_I69.XSR.g16168.t1.cds [Oikopleura dioica]
MYVPRDYSDVFTSLKDFEMFLKRAKDDILDELQNFIQFAEDAPWTARQTCQEHRYHHIVHFFKTLSHVAHDSFESSLRLANKFTHIQEALDNYAERAAKELPYEELEGLDLMDEISQNISYNNADFDELSSWYYDTHKFYKHKLMNAKNELNQLVLSFGVEDIRGDAFIQGILFTIRSTMEKYNNNVHLMKLATNEMANARNCGPHVIEEQYREEEDEQVEKLAKLIKDLGMIRYNFNRKIPSDYASLEDMLAKIGKEKQHSLGRASLHIRMIPEQSEVMKTSELFRQILTLSTVDEFVPSDVEGIREEFPEYVNNGHVYANLTQIYVPKAAKYKNMLKRAFFLFRKARALMKKTYEDNDRLFKEQDKKRACIHQYLKQIASK